MTTIYSQSLRYAVTASRALLASLSGTIAEHELKRAGSGYARATGALEVSLSQLADIVSSSLDDDAKLEASRPSLAAILAAASARLGPTTDAEVAERQAREVATVLVGKLDLEALLALAVDGTCPGRLQLERQHVGMTIEDVLALELQQYIAYYLIDQWQDAQDRAQQAA